MEPTQEVIKQDIITLEIAHHKALTILMREHTFIFTQLRNLEKKIDTQNELIQKLLVKLGQVEGVN